MIHTITDFNFTVDGILNVVHAIQNADLFVMGQRGKTTLADRLFGEILQQQLLILYLLDYCYSRRMYRFRKS